LGQQDNDKSDDACKQVKEFLMSKISLLRNSQFFINF
jgi:hypothetical protein